MGFRTSSARRSSAQSAVASSIVVLPDTTGTGPTLSGGGVTANTTINKQIVAVGQSATQATTVLSGVTVTSVFVTDSSFNNIDDTALDPAGGYLKIIGNGFKTGCTVFLNGSSVTTTFISSNELRVTTPASSVGTYNLMVFNTDGNGAIYLNLSVSNMPTYTTSAGSLGTVYETNPYTQSVVATGDAPLTYSLYSGTLPPNATLAANGVISGTSPVENSSNTYSFVVNVKDAQGQDTTRSFSLTINTDVITWSSPANNAIYSFIGGSPISNVSLAATSAAGKTITYTANTLPIGVSLSGNTIFGTPNTAQTVYTELTATSATTNRTAKRYIAWDITLGDTYFKYVTLLLNGETAVTPFISDASANSQHLVIVGDTRPSTFSPYEDDYYSNYFDGTGDYLSFPSSSALALPGDFTVEAWVNISSFAAERCLLDLRGATGTVGLIASITSTTGYPFIYKESSGFVVTSSIAITLNTWTHVAFVRSGTTTTIYVNGVSGGSATDSTSWAAPNGTGRIGANKDAGTPVLGYISNFRIVKGTAVYTTAFTPPTAPLTAIVNTQLLTCQSNRFIDKSTNNITITGNGETSVTDANPFPINSSFATYGSAYFDGTGDYLTLTPTINIGTNDFTVEAWVYRTATTTLQTFFSLNSYTSGILMRWETSVFGLYIGSTAHSIAIPNQNGMPLNQWSHVALVRQSGVCKLYINGTQVYSFNSTYSLAITSAMIGRSIHSSTELWNGYIADARVVANTAVYTANTAPPTAPLTAIANTSLLTLQTNGGGNNSGFRDSSPINNLILRTGNATQSRFSPFSATGWSNYFDGSGDYLTVTDIPSIELGSSNFTIEGWFNWTDNTANWSLFYKASSYELKSDTNRWVWQLNGASNVFVTSWTPVVGQWYHIALVRNSTTTTLYINGTAFTSGTSVNAGDNTNSLQIGSGTTGFTGFISNFRMVLGTAVYTSNFTPSIIPLTAISNTSLLTCQSNRFIDNSTNNFTVTKNGDVTVESFSPFSPANAPSATINGGSVYFDGTSDCLTLPAGKLPQLGTQNFTMEAWVWTNTIAAGTNGVFDMWNGGQTSFLLRRNTADFQFYVQGGSTTSVTGLKTKTWYHVAVVRNGTTIRMYLNGTAVGTAITGYSTSITNTAALGIGGVATSGNESWNGYIADARIVLGTAVYTSNFTPPTAPLTPISGTRLLLSGTNGAIVDGHSALMCETSGNAQLSTAVKKFGNASIYLDGTTNTRLFVPASPLLMFGTGDFTVEFWMNTSDTSFGLINPSSTTGSGYWGILVAGSTLYWQSAYNVSNLKTASLSGYLNNTWVHIAIVRSSGVLNFYFNGTVQGTGTSDTTNYNGTNNGLYIGQDTQTNGYFIGYLDDIRITKGYARYTTNFTAPSSAFVAQ